MRLFDMTLPTPAENLTLDEALLEAAEDDAAGEALRLWESPEPVVVVGRASRLDEEVHQAECERRGVPVLRRVSGGAAIVAGPGCLMYGVVLSTARRPELTQVDQAHRFVLNRLTKALSTLSVDVELAGTSDLALSSRAPGEPLRKISGNSLRMKREWLLYHGTILYDFELPLVAELLKQPPRRPDYRGDRHHEAFVANVPADRAAITKALTRAWDAQPTNDDYPRERVAALVQERYGRAAWNASR